MSRTFIKLRLCYCYVICHSVIDNITGPVCGEITDHHAVDSRCKGTLEWSFGGLVYGDSISGRFPLENYFMLARTSCLPDSIVGSELKSHDAYGMSLLCVICQFDIPHGWTSG